MIVTAHPVIIEIKIPNKKPKAMPGPRKKRKTIEIIAENEKQNFFCPRKKHRPLS
jgi:hypothetical protein